MILEGGQSPSNKDGGCVKATEYGEIFSSPSTFNLGFTDVLFQGCAAVNSQKGGALALENGVLVTFENIAYAGNTPDDISSGETGTPPTVVCASAPDSCNDVVTKDTADTCEALGFPVVPVGDNIKSAIEGDDKCKGCMVGSTSGCRASCSDTNGVTANVVATDSTNDCGGAAVKNGVGRSYLTYSPRSIHIICPLEPALQSTLMSNSFSRSVLPPPATSQTTPHAPGRRATSTAERTKLRAVTLSRVTETRRRSQARRQSSLLTAPRRRITTMSAL